MALRALMLNKKIQEKRNELTKIREKAAELVTRENELELAIEEAKTEEEMKTVEEEIEKLEQDKKDTEADATKLEEEIRGLEEELGAVERAKEAVKDTATKAENAKKERTGGTETMIKRGIFAGRTMEERKAFFERDDVKDFAERARELKNQKRGVTGAELTIPEVVLELIKENLPQHSKLIKHVRLRSLKGKARQNIAGTLPEGIWTEAVASVKELTISFNQIEMDGYKVGGYIPIPNSTLEDSDENLVTEIMEALAEAIGIAVDKAILYGTGKKMPLGIVTRLAQETEPESWGANAPKWTGLKTTNIKALNITALEGAKFFAGLIKGLGIAKEKKSDGRKVWCMNSTTKMEILAKAVTFNAAGTVVATMNDEMPVIGGKIETFDFMQDGDIAGGYVSLYTLVERKGGTFATSDQAMFIEDQTVFKGTARYDGMPVLGEAFVAINIGTTAPQVKTTFAGQEEATDQTTTSGSEEE